MNPSFKSPEQSSGNHLENKEKEIRDLIKLLPKQLADTWQDRWDETELSDVDFLRQLKLFISDRKRALMYHVETSSHLSEEMRNEIQMVLDHIQNSFGNEATLLGNGKTAVVHFLEISPHICVKYIYNREQYVLNNPIAVEYGFIDDLRTLAYKNVRTPLPGFQSSDDSYGMERINGRSLLQIYENPERDIELIKVAKKIGRKQFLENVLGYLRKMHEEVKIIHGDLLMGNIMLDKDGDIFIIDFGKAYRIELGEDRDDKKKGDEYIAKREINKFFDKVDKIKDI